VSHAEWVAATAKRGSLLPESPPSSVACATRREGETGDEGAYPALVPATVVLAMASRPLRARVDSSRCWPRTDQEEWIERLSSSDASDAGTLPPCKAAAGTVLLALLLPPGCERLTG
jgi:hypothetical protein